MIQPYTRMTPVQEMNVHGGNTWLHEASKRYNANLQTMGMEVDLGPPGHRGVDTLAYVGDVALGEDPSLWEALTSSSVRKGAALALLYHGYKRNRGDVIWSAIWALFGYAVPPVAGVVALAQGYGKAKYGPPI